MSPKERYRNRSSKSFQVSPETIDHKNGRSRLLFVYLLNSYVYMHMHIVIINVKKPSTWEWVENIGGVWGVIAGRAWREESGVMYFYFYKNIFKNILRDSPMSFWYALPIVLCTGLATRVPSPWCPANRHQRTDFQELSDLHICTVTLTGLHNPIPYTLNKHFLKGFHILKTLYLHAQMQAYSFHLFDRALK